jgi:BolA protein
MSSMHSQIERAVLENFSVSHFDLKNESHMHSGPATESHFKLVLVSEDFNDLSKVKRQQSVYKVLSSLMPQFHALGLHTYTPEEWTKVSMQAPDSPKCSGGRSKQSI